MVDEELKQKMIDKIQSDEFGVEDIDDYMNLFCQIANESDAVQDEVKGQFANKTLVFYIDDFKTKTLKLRDCVFSIEDTDSEEWDSTVKTSAENFAGLISGQKDGNSLYMSGQLEVHGGLPNIIKFQTILQVIIEELGI